MKKNYLAISIFFAAFSMSAQTVVFSEDFSSYNTPDQVSSQVSLGDLSSNWFQQNIDGYNQYTNNSTLFDDYMNSYGYRVMDFLFSGKGLVTRSSPAISNAFAYSSDVLRTPLISLPANPSSTSLKFDIQELYGGTFDTLQVYISTNPSFSSPKQLLQAITSISSLSSKTIDISSYNGQNIYVYFLAKNKIYNALGAATVNADYLFIDNIKITQGTVTSINNNKIKLGFNLYPNPCNNTLNIEHSSNINADCFVIITDVTGKIIKQEEIDEVEIDVISLHTGLYFVTIISDNERETHKFFKN